MYTAYLLDKRTRDFLLKEFKPRYCREVAHHVTEAFGVPEGTSPPKDAILEVVGYLDSQDGLEVLIVSVNGRTMRPDGSVYHVTWSLDPDKYRPYDSNEVIAKSDSWQKALYSNLSFTPAVLR